MSDNLVHELFEGLSRLQASPKVYPAYIAFRARNALRQPDPKLGAADQVIETPEAVSAVETLGSARYAFTVTDHNGSTYKVTVELQERAR